ncbi:hypothetical protein Tco_0812508 [Tanacetum coccineum]
MDDPNITMEEYIRIEEEKFENVGKCLTKKLPSMVRSDIDDGAQVVPAPIHVPPPAAGRTMPQRLGRLEEEVQGLRQDVRSLRGLVERSMTDQGRFSTWMVSCMTQLMEASGLTY